MRVYKKRDDLVRKRKLWFLLILMYLIRKRRITKIRRRTVYMRPLMESRKADGAFQNLIMPMRTIYADEHFDYLRMTATRFEDLLQNVGPIIFHAPTHRYPISIKERLVVTVRYLATGESLSSLSYSFRIGIPTLSGIIRETAKAIWTALVQEHMPLPTRAKWKSIGQEFFDKWNFPLCLGVVDGRHCAIKNPPHAGSKFFNYKGFFSIVLLALVDANYQFIFVDIGGHGREGDSGLFRKSKFGQRMQNAMNSYENGGLSIPPDGFLPGTNQKSPYVFLGDQAFALKRHLMKPYMFKKCKKPEHIFNYRLSRARRVVENAFGIISTRFRVLEKRMDLDVAAVDDVVKACCILHNYLKSNDMQDHADQPRYCPPGYLDYEDEEGNVVLGDWHKNADVQELFQHLPAIGNARTVEYNVRENLKQYFLSPEGSVPWQERAVSGDYQ